MDYARISRIEKSKIYAEERQDRVTVESLRVSILGDNNGAHAVTYDDGNWTCDCNYFKTRQEVCSHIMAMERILADMVELA
jgi:hypothetical protein